MEFFDKLGKKATEAYKVTADKTGKIAKETKMKFRMGELRNQINDLYEDIGKAVYENHVANNENDIQQNIDEKCTQIDVLSDEINSLLQECLDLNDKKQCSQCFTEIEKDNKFCPKCGAEQKEEPAKEVEIVSDTNNEEQSAETNKTDENDKEQSSSAEKSDEVEETEHEENKAEDTSNEEKDNLEKTVEVESDNK